MKRPIMVFSVCAATEKDEALQQQLDTHLALLKRQGVLVNWQEGIAGAPWKENREQGFNEASLILLLISPDFLASDVCYEEQQRAMERQCCGEVEVVPILLRPVDWKGAPFAHLQVLPLNKKPITRWLDQDEAFEEVTKGIRCLIEKVPVVEQQVNDVKRKDCLREVPAHRPSRQDSRQ